MVKIGMTISVALWFISLKLKSHAGVIIGLMYLQRLSMLKKLLLFRWFKFTFKPPYIASRMTNYDWPFGTLPFGFFWSNLDIRDLETYHRDLFWSFLKYVNF